MGCALVWFAHQLRIDCPVAQYVHVMLRPSCARGAQRRVRCASAPLPSRSTQSLYHESFNSISVFSFALSCLQMPPRSYAYWSSHMAAYDPRSVVLLPPSRTVDGSIIGYTYARGGRRLSRHPYYGWRFTQTAMWTPAGWKSLGPLKRVSQDRSFNAVPSAIVKRWFTKRCRRLRRVKQKH